MRRAGAARYGRYMSSNGSPSADAAAHPAVQPAAPDARRTRRGNAAAAALLLAAPVLLAFTFVGIVLVPVVAVALGPAAWPAVTRARAGILGLQTLAAMVVGGLAILPFFGLCGPDSDGVIAGAFLAGFAGYTVFAWRALTRPQGWPLAPLAGAGAFDAVMAVAMVAGVSWSC
jgi:hypothetical protein